MQGSWNEAPDSLQGQGRAIAGKSPQSLTTIPCSIPGVNGRLAVQAQEESKGIENPGTYSFLLPDTPSLESDNSGLLGCLCCPLSQHNWVSCKVHNKQIPLFFHLAEEESMLLTTV